MTASTDTITLGVTRLRRHSTLRVMTAAGAVIIAALVAVPAVSADRLPDKDVKALLERINNERDRFEDQLDGKIKSSILRGASGEVHVERFLDDLQENVGRLKSGHGHPALHVQAATGLRRRERMDPTGVEP